MKGNCVETVLEKGCNCCNYKMDVHKLPKPLSCAAESSLSI